MTLCILLTTSPIAAQSSNIVYADVYGLVCDFCARALEKVFGKQDEVERINVDLDNHLITIHFNQGQKLDDKTITRLINDSGYNVQEIRHGEE